MGRSPRSEELLQGDFRERFKFSVDGDRVVYTTPVTMWVVLMMRHGAEAYGWQGLAGGPNPERV